MPGVIGNIGYRNVEAPCAFVHPCDIFCDVGGIDDDQVIISEIVDERIIDNPAVGATHQRIIRPTRQDRGNIIRHQILKEPQRIRSAHFHLTHMADIEQTGCFAHCAMFLDDPAVLNRHLPTAKRHHPRTQRQMTLVEWRATQPNRLTHQATSSSNKKRQGQTSRLTSVR
jgi:hypothetical protein